MAISMETTRKTALAVILLLALSGIAFCDRKPVSDTTVQQSDTSIQDNERVLQFIAEHKWKMIQMNGAIQDQSPVFMKFDTKAGKVSGSSGCNRFFGGFAIDKNTLSFNGLASTRMACLNHEKSRIESEFLGLVSDKTFNFDVADQTLNLYTGDKLVLMLGMDDSE